jgi:hypothetical protein
VVSRIQASRAPQFARSARAELMPCRAYRWIGIEVYRKFTELPYP